MVGRTAGVEATRAIEFDAGVTNPLIAVKRSAKRAKKVGLIMVNIELN